MAKETQFKLLTEVLQEFHAAGLLKNVMLVGSWCLFFYKQDFENSDRLPAIRTMDVDFLISDWRKLKQDTDVPVLLQRLGFVSTHNRANDLMVYDHPELRVEFLVPETGKGDEKPRTIDKLHIKAQGLRYLNFLAAYPKTVRYEGMSILVPEPPSLQFTK